MKKRVTDLTFDDLAIAGRQAAAAAIAESHSAGLSTWSQAGPDVFLESLPDGTVIRHAATDVRAKLIGGGDNRKPRKSAAA